jgi:hypothetical protein
MSGWAGCCATTTAQPEPWDEFSDTTGELVAQRAVFNGEVALAAAEEGET